MTKRYMKGNEPLAEAAILAGLDAFFGYPITPASEIPETLAKYYPKKLKTFIQAESEIGAINMVLGAASCGKRVMTASSGPGISLKQECISYIVGCEIPCVIVNIMRGGPGLGNIASVQGDYFQATRGGGHGDYYHIVLAPNCAQEMVDLTIDAFNLAGRYRNPVMILADANLGQMKENIDFPDEAKIETYNKSWTTTGCKNRKPNIITSIHLAPDEMEQHILKLFEKFGRIKENEVRYEEYKTEDAKLICCAYGLASRVAKDSIDKARTEGLKVGLLRPISLWPFPSKKCSDLAERVDFLVTEMSMGQMVEDVRLAVNGKSEVHFYGRTGGMIPTELELYDKIKELLR